MFKFLTAAAVAAFAMSGAVSASTAVPSFTSTPGGFDAIFVESDGKRPGAIGDLVGAGLDIGALDGGLTGAKIGIGGRMVNGIDIWSFSSATSFTVSLTDLMLGDGNSGYDSSDTAFSENDVTTARFSLLDSASSVVDSIDLISSVAPPAFSFSAGPGAYTFVIDGGAGFLNVGSTYDIAIDVAPIPVPAALPLLGAALGMLGLMRRRAAV